MKAWRESGGFPVPNGGVCKEVKRVVRAGLTWDRAPPRSVSHGGHSAAPISATWVRMRAPACANHGMGLAGP